MVLADEQQTGTPEGHTMWTSHLSSAACSIAFREDNVLPGELKLFH